jgi:hypothetical protein
MGTTTNVGAVAIACALAGALAMGCSERVESFDTSNSELGARDLENGTKCSRASGDGGWTPQGGEKACGADGYEYRCYYKSSVEAVEPDDHLVWGRTGARCTDGQPKAAAVSAPVCTDGPSRCTSDGKLETCTDASGYSVAGDQTSEAAKACQSRVAPADDCSQEPGVAQAVRDACVCKRAMGSWTGRQCLMRASTSAPCATRDAKQCVVTDTAYLVQICDGATWRRGNEYAPLSAPSEADKCVQEVEE